MVCDGGESNSESWGCKDKGDWGMCGGVDGGVAWGVALEIGRRLEEICFLREWKLLDGSKGVDLCTGQGRDEDWSQEKVIQGF